MQCAYLGCAHKGRDPDPQRELTLGEGGIGGTSAGQGCACVRDAIDATVCASMHQTHDVELGKGWLLHTPHHEKLFTTSSDTLWFSNVRVACSLTVFCPDATPLSAPSLHLCH